MSETSHTLAVIPVNQLQPDDVIVCQHKGNLSREQHKMVHDAISSKFPGFKILVHDSRVSLSIQRPVPA